MLAACASVALGIPLAWSIAADPATDMVSAAIRQAQDLTDLLSQRSPGARTAAELTKTKHARVAARVLTLPKAATPAGQPSAPGIGTTADLIDLLQPPLAPVGLTPPGPQAPFAPPSSLATILASAPGTSTFTPPGENNGPVSFPTAEPREVVPATSAVPEPGTWAMMLMGFAFIGWRVRTRKRAPKKLTA